MATILKKSQRLNYGIAIVLSLLVGAIGGTVLGWNLGLRPILNNWAQEQSRDVKGNIELLRLLRQGKTSQTIENIESRLDDDLVVLLPEEISLRPRIEAEIFEALRAAKSYREVHPRKSKRDMVDRMVEHVLAQDLSRP